MFFSWTKTRNTILKPLVWQDIQRSKWAHTRQITFAWTKSPCRCFPMPESLRGSTLGTPCLITIEYRTNPKNVKVGLSNHLRIDQCEHPHKIWLYILYSTSILGSWNSHLPIDLPFFSFSSDLRKCGTTNRRSHQSEVCFFVGRQLMGRLRELDQSGMTGCSGSHKCIFSILV